MSPERDPAEPEAHDFDVEVSLSPAHRAALVCVVAGVGLTAGGLALAALGWWSFALPVPGGITCLLFGLGALSDRSPGPKTTAVAAVVVMTAQLLLLMALANDDDPRWHPRGVARAAQVLVIPAIVAPGWCLAMLANGLQRTRR